jgi:hypothetical protein
LALTRLGVGRPVRLGTATALVLTLTALAFARAASADAPAPSLNGFVLAPRSVPVDEILSGGPPRDGIPALEDPAVTAAKGAPWSDEEVVLGVVVNGEARAYPVALLDWHELVNDTLGGEPILVSYCPLCGSALVFERRVEGKSCTFGVSGLLYRSDLLLYDRVTETLWSQIMAQAVAGPRNGTRLRVLRSEMMRFGAWRAKHPDSTVLTPDTGHRRPYGRSPYDGYQDSKDVYFPAPIDERYHPKMPTLGLRVPGGSARAYPAVEIINAGGLIEERFEGHAVKVTYDPEDQVFGIDAPAALEVVEGYWFAWAAFHPSSTVFVAAEGLKPPSAGNDTHP